MAHTKPKTDLDSAFEDEAQAKPSQHAGGAARSQSPLLPAMSAILGAVGLACGFKVSWIVCIVGGVAAVVLGVSAHRRGAPQLFLAKLGIALGAVGILLSLALIAILVYQITSLGLA